MEKTKESPKKVGEKEIFEFIRENQESAQELYQALAGTDGGMTGKVELRENTETYFLAKEGGAIFAFAKSAEKSDRNE